MIEQGIVKKASESFHEESQNEAIKNVRPPSSESEKLISKTKKKKKKIWKIPKHLRKREPRREDERREGPTST